MAQDKKDYGRALLERLEPFLRDGQLVIGNAELWEIIKAEGRGPCVRALAQMAVRGDLAFPYKATFLPPPEELFRNLRAEQHITTSEIPYSRSLPALLRHRYPWSFEGRELAMVVGPRAYDRVDVLTDHFTEEARMEGRVRGSEPPSRAWRKAAQAEEAVHNAIAVALNGDKNLDTYALREGCYRALPECTLFKVTLAAEICRFFEARQVLDPFAGWGDRALGAAGAGVARYVGVDPNPGLDPGHQKLLSFLAGQGVHTHAFRILAFEAYGPDRLQADFGGAAPDLVFSSPPFADYEVYSTDPGQSSRYARLGDWLREWLLPVTDQAWRYLAPGGHLVYYLADAKGEVAGPLLRHMEAAGRPFRGIIACRRGWKRPLPLWVWRKEAAAAKA